ncbi:hypothetical protein [Amycolatopsis sp. NPDC051903]|uniref:hypothetical protein n=1 Tax=Amycolatopsis sp. NPDC051903 TaxID=3363936 RepID=UPI0037AF2D05
MAGTLDGLVKRFVNPVMKDAGFHRLPARKWWISVPDGHAVFPRMRPYIPEPIVMFHVAAAAVPSVLRDYHDEGSSSKPVEFDWGLIRTRLRAPEGLRAELLPGTSLWGVSLDRVDVDGPKMFDYFRDFVVPRWKSFLAPTVLAHSAYGGRQDDFAIMRRYGEDFGRVILGVDNGDPQELEVAIDNLIAAGSDRDLLEWLRRRLHSRVAKRS